MTTLAQIAEELSGEYSLFKTLADGVAIDLWHKMNKQLRVELGAGGLERRDEPLERGDSRWVVVVAYAHSLSPQGRIVWPRRDSKKLKLDKLCELFQVSEKDFRWYVTQQDKS